MPNYLGIAAAGFVVAAFTAHSAIAADRAAGRELARMCSICHGKKGIGKDPEVPNIAGQPAFYIEKSLVDYQTGARQDRRMTLIAGPLSRDEIRNLAEWYSSIKITAEVSD